MRLPKKGRGFRRSYQPNAAGKTLPSLPDAPLAEFREMAGWSFFPLFFHPLAHTRLGPDYFKGVYCHGKCGVESATAWLAEHGLTTHCEAQELVHQLHSLDQLLFYDGVDIVNSAACECIARWCIAIQRTYDIGRASSSGFG